jgi:hypothetical protein
VKRRECIAFLGGAAAWPLGARAVRGKVATVGLLGSGKEAAASALGGQGGGDLARVSLPPTTGKSAGFFPLTIRPV